MCCRIDVQTRTGSELNDPVTFALLRSESVHAEGVP